MINQTNLSLFKTLSLFFISWILLSLKHCVRFNSYRCVTDSQCSSFKPCPTPTPPSRRRRSPSGRQSISLMLKASHTQPLWMKLGSFSNIAEQLRLLWNNWMRGAKSGPVACTFASARRRIWLMLSVCISLSGLVSRGYSIFMLLQPHVGNCTPCWFC